MPLRVQNVEYFHTVLREIEEAQTTHDLLYREASIDLLGLLEDKLRYLHHYRSGEWDVSLGYDFAKWSFSLLWLDAEGKPVFNGGLIFHAPGLELFSVEICSVLGPHWSIHT